MDGLTSVVIRGNPDIIRCHVHNGNESTELLEGRRSQRQKRKAAFLRHLLTNERSEKNSVVRSQLLNCCSTTNAITISLSLSLFYCSLKHTVCQRNERTLRNSPLDDIDSKLVARIAFERM